MDRLLLLLHLCILHLLLFHKIIERKWGDGEWFNIFELKENGRPVHSPLSSSISMIRLVRIAANGIFIPFVSQDNKNEMGGIVSGSIYLN